MQKPSPRRKPSREAAGIDSVSIGEINRRIMSAKTRIKNSIHNSETVESFHSNFVFRKPRPETAAHRQTAPARDKAASDDPVARPPPQHAILEQKIAEINQDQRRRAKILDRRSENEKLRQAKLAAEAAHSSKAGLEPGAGAASAFEIAKCLEKGDRPADEEKRVKTEKSEKSRQDALAEQPVDGMMKEHLQRKAFLTTSNLLTAKAPQKKPHRSGEELERPQQGLVGHEAGIN